MGVEIWGRYENPFTPKQLDFDVDRSMIYLYTNITKIVLICVLAK